MPRVFLRCHVPSVVSFVVQLFPLVCASTNLLRKDSSATFPPPDNEVNSINQMQISATSAEYKIKMSGEKHLANLLRFGIVSLSDHVTLARMISAWNYLRFSSSPKLNESNAQNSVRTRWLLTGRNSTRAHWIESCHEWTLMMTKLISFPWSCESDRVLHCLWAFPAYACRKYKNISCFNHKETFLCLRRLIWRTNKMT